MKTFPMFLQVAGRRVVVVGGGEQAAQKVRLMLKTEAHIEVFAEGLDDELATLARQGRITHRPGRVQATHFEDCALVFIASGCRGIDGSLHALAKAAGATVNVVDQPHLCDAITPSIVDRDPVVVAIGTEGTAPVLARQIKTQMELMLEPRLGDLAALAGRLRAMAAQRLSPRNRRDLWRWVFSSSPRDAQKRGAEREAARLIKQAIENGVPQMDHQGSVALVGAGPGAKDLITLRGVQRLQEADVIYYDRLIDPEVMDLARRDAERVYVGKRPGCHAWPQDRINDVLVRAAQRGQRVVRLKCGDPGVFARGSEEIEALEQAGIPIEIVPGVTAASAAAASSGTMLTERGKVDTLMLATGHSEDGVADPNWLKQLRPGVRVALYMAVRAAPRIQSALLSNGFASDISVTVIADAQRPSEKIITCDPQSLVDALEDNGIKNSAIIFVTLPKGAKYAVEPVPQVQADRLRVAG